MRSTGAPLPAPEKLAEFAETRRNSIFGEDDRVAVGDTTDEPWRAIGKVIVTADAGVFSGTGFLIGPYHMLTAGHVVHSPAYGGDGRATGVEVSFGAAGGLAPFGRAVATEWRALPGWTVSALPGEDWALVTLDRSVGTTLGVFELGANGADDFYDGLTATLAGYPGDLAGGQDLYASAGTIASGTAEQLFYNGTLDTAGGMSGAPVWQTASATGTRTAIGIHAAGVVDPGVPGAANVATRLTSDRIVQIEEWQGQDAIVRPPVDLPDLSDGGAVDPLAAAALSATQATVGEMLTLSLSPRNLGTAVASGYSISVYASTNATITPLDSLIGEIAGPTLTPFETASLDIPVVLPANLPSGTYHIGWVLDSGEVITEFNETDNSAVLPTLLEVSALPDLVVDDLTLSSLSWVPGQVVTVEWLVRNGGGIASPAVPSGLYISSDPQVTTSDTRLLFDASGVVLAPGQTATEGAPFSFTYNDNLPPGDYWVAALVDPDASVSEADETNNTSAAVWVSIGETGQLFLGDDLANGIAATPDNDTLRGFNGNDTLVGREGGDLLEGGGDDDQAFGDAGQDTLYGGFGFDTLFGNLGDDLLYGDTGNGVDGQGDVLNGGSGADTLIGEGGPDTLSGEAGADVLEGGPGFDQLNGNGGPDTLLGGALRDSLLGGDGDDRIEGEDGNDDIYAGSGNDTVLGGEGPDFADGEMGDDSLDGGPDDDILLGGSGDDTLDGGSGIDRLLGGSGADLLRGGPGGDRLFSGGGGDTVEGGSGDDLIFGNGGDDRALGGSGNDSLVGEAGRDTLEGGSGNDLLAGREDGDSLLGGDGHDIVDGEAGDDHVDGGDGDDSVFGQQGADWLAGGPGADFLGGGADNDTLSGGPGPDRLGGDGGVDLFLFEPGDGADYIFDLALGTETIWISGGVGSFAALVFGTDPSGWLTVGYSTDPGDVLTLQGVLPGQLTDDGTIEFV
ncbi:MAG: CARDB domain-containing protein [Pseudomonadota bacterium]